MADVSDQRCNLAIEEPGSWHSLQQPTKAKDLQFVARRTELDLRVDALKAQSGTASKLVDGPVRDGPSEELALQSQSSIPFVLHLDDDTSGLQRRSPKFESQSPFVPSNRYCNSNPRQVRAQTPEKLIFLP